MLRSGSNWSYYERLIARFPGRIFGRFFISVLLGFAFLAEQYGSIGNRIFDDWSWFLGMLISTVMLCL
jgi:hypothetical protein